MIDKLFNHECAEAIVNGILIGIALTVSITIFTGCTTLEHEKECTCDCKQNEAHFECNGVHYYKHKDIK